MKTAVCDDDELFLERIKNMLQTYPEVSACDTYNDINALFDKIDVGMRYDLVFMDVEWKTQKEDGIQYAARLSAQYPDMQIIFVTAYNDRFSQKIFWQPVNLCGYLVKPVSEENLSVLLKKAESSCLANCTAGSAAPLPGARPYSSAETAAELTAFSKENPFFL